MHPSDVLLFSFASLDAAAQARHALLEAGVPEQSVRLSERQDEAGPVEGNFVSGNGRTPGRRPAGPIPAPDAPYPANLEDPENRGVHLLELVPPRGRKGELEALLRKRGGVDATERADQALGNAGDRSF